MSETISYHRRNSGRIAELSELVAVEFDLGEDYIERVCDAAALHGLRERITDPAATTPAVARLARASHEHFDGSGYPNGLRDEQIPLGSRIIGTCRAFNGLVSPRGGAAALTPSAALGELRRGAGVRFDPRVIELLATVLARRATLAQAA